MYCGWGHSVPDQNEYYKNKHLDKWAKTIYFSPVFIEFFFFHMAKKKFHTFFMMKSENTKRYPCKISYR